MLVGALPGQRDIDDTVEPVGAPVLAFQAPGLQIGDRVAHLDLGGVHLRIAGDPAGRSVIGEPHLLPPIDGRRQRLTNALVPGAHREPHQVLLTGGLGQLPGGAAGRLPDRAGGHLGDCLQSHQQGDRFVGVKRIGRDR